MVTTVATKRAPRKRSSILPMSVPKYDYPPPSAHQQALTALREWGESADLNETLNTRPMAQSNYSPLSLGLFDTATKQQVMPHILCKEYTQEYLTAKYSGGHPGTVYNYTVPKHVTRDTRCTMVFGVPTAMNFNLVVRDLLESIRKLADDVKAVALDTTILPVFSEPLIVVPMESKTFSTADLYSGQGYTDKATRRVVLVSYPEAWEHHPSLFSLFCGYLRSGYAAAYWDASQLVLGQWGVGGVPMSTMYSDSDLRSVLRGKKYLKTLLGNVSKPGYNITATYQACVKQVGGRSSMHGSSGTVPDTCVKIANYKE